jgi:hypothetical protein
MMNVAACVSTFRGHNDLSMEVTRKPLRLITSEQIRSALTDRGWEVVDDDEVETCLIRPSDCRLLVIHHPAR